MDLRLWRVTADRCNHSTFNGGRRTPSDYSALTCLACGASWRTKADYPDALPLYNDAESRRVKADIAREKSVRTLDAEGGAA